MANCTNPLSAEMKDYLKTMGAVVRNERLQQNWSGAELAKRAGVGVNTIWNIENGNASVSLKNVLSVLDALDCSDLILKTIPSDSSVSPTRQRARKHRCQVDPHRTLRRTDQGSQNDPGLHKAQRKAEKFLVKKQKNGIEHNYSDI